MAKEFIGGKYQKKSGRERGTGVDVELISYKENGKTYWTLRYVGYSNRKTKSLPRWRNSDSPKKYAKKHNFHII